MPPLVSICLPVYNGERFLPEAIDSALAQKFADFELLIADDCSSDQSWEIANNYARRDHRIQVWRNSVNKGLFQNYNETLSRASGRLIKLFAQDDRWGDRILERCVDAFRDHEKLALIAVQRKQVTAVNEQLPAQGSFEETTRLSGADMAKSCLLSGLNLIGEPSAVMFPREFIGDGFDPQYYHLGDLDYWCRILAKGDYLYVHEPLCEFRRHDASATDKNTKGLLFILDLLSLVDQYADLVSQAGMTPHELKVQIVTKSAAFVRYLFLRGEATLEELLRQLPADEAGRTRQLKQFKELAFYALLVAASPKAELEFRVNALEAKLHSAEEELARALDSKAPPVPNIFRSIAGRFISTIR